MSPTRSRGVSLVEVLVSLTLLEVAATLGLAAALAAARLDHAARQRTAIDLARRDAVASARAAVSCRTVAAPQVVALTLSAGPGRPPFATAIRCGR